MLTNKEKILYSSVVVVAVGLGMYLLREKQFQEQTTKKVVTYQELNQVRVGAIHQHKLDQQKVAVTNWKTAPKLDNNLREVSNGMQDTSSGIQLEGEKIHSVEDAADASVYDSPMNSLETQINKKLVNDQHAAQMSMIQKKEFIKEYKKRALTMGYNVELNDRLELVRADKITSKVIGFDKAPASVNDVETMEEDQYVDEE